MSMHYDKTPVVYFPVELLKARIAERSTEPARPRAIERRASVRHPCDLEALSRPISLRKGDCPCLGRVRNISTGGIGLILGRRFEPGTFLSVELQNKSQNHSRTFVTRVMHATPLLYGGWTHGCAFVDKLSDADVKAFLS